MEMTQEEAEALRRLTAQVDGRLVEIAEELEKLQAALLRASQLAAHAKADLRLMQALRRRAVPALPG